MDIDSFFKDHIPTTFGNKTISELFPVLLALLTLLGIACLLALVVLLVRHFCFDEGTSADRNAVKNRAIRICGMLVLVAFTAVGGTSLANQTKEAAPFIPSQQRDAFLPEESNVLRPSDHENALASNPAFILFGVASQLSGQSASNPITNMSVEAIRAGLRLIGENELADGIKTPAEARMLPAETLEKAISAYNASNENS